MFPSFVASVLAVLATPARRRESVTWKPGFGRAASGTTARPRSPSTRRGTSATAFPAPPAAVLIVVAEDLLPATLVKADRPRESPTRRVLKLNHVRDIPTGVYTYQQMLSAFLRGRSPGSRSS